MGETGFETPAKVPLGISLTYFTKDDETARIESHFFRLFVTLHFGETSSLEMPEMPERVA